MAKKRKAAAARRVAGDEIRLVSQRDLRALMDQCISYENKAATATGHMGELVREYAEKKNLHNGAFAMVKKLCRMGQKDPSKLWLILAHFDDYRQKLGVDRMAKEQGQLLPAGTDGNVERLRPREVEEAAGDAA